MSDDCVVSEIVTEFFLNTCQLRTPREHAVRAALYCCHTANVHPDDDVHANYVPLITGSVAEFYIEPMLPLVGDIDIMYHRNTELAIPRGHPPPTQLPAEFHNYVKVFEIIDSHLPGYVYLELRHLLTECSDNGNYKAVDYDTQPYAKNSVIPINTYKGLHTERHGPASCTRVPEIGYHIDTVPCVHCLTWPPQAADWQTRHRNYGWPDTGPVDRVISNGCDVVPVAHRRCRQHEWMGTYQWRLSFSRAEILLINSWMQEQQIVYHMLRVFIKIESFKNRSKPSVISNYHIKTLMLWACELKPRSWWTDNTNLVRICTQLLHTLRVWLTDTHCSHYFVSDCNLTDDSFKSKWFGRKLMSVDESWLSTWFVNNYIRRCSQFCPNYAARSFVDLTTNIKLQNAVSEVVLWRLNTVLLDSGPAFYIAEYGIPVIVFSWSLTGQPCVCTMTELGKIDKAFTVYFTATAFLHVVRKIRSSGFTNDLMDVLATVLGQSLARRYSNQRNSVLSLCKASKLMSELVLGNTPFNTTQMVKTELSKAYLHTTLRCKDSDSDSIYCLTNVYLAVLYYTTGQYQAAIDHCTLVTRSQDHLQCTSRVVQGDVLPKIDDNIDNALGLSVLYQYVRTSALNHQQETEHALVYTTQLFAHYLLSACLSVTSDVKLTQAAERQQYMKRVGITQQLFTADLLLFVCANHLSENKLRLRLALPNCQRMSTIAAELNKSDMVELLQKSAVEHLTTYRQLKAQIFCPVTTIVTTDYEALYAYKCGDYQQCLQLSTQNVHTLLSADSISIVPDNPVPTHPEFIQLLDDDIVSLTALTVIVNPECRNPESVAGKFNDKRQYVCISPLTLSLYLMTQCQLKLHHHVSSLKQTLDYVKVAQERHPVQWTLDRLTLKLAERKAVSYIAMTVNP